eukprot:280231_1
MFVMKRYCDYDYDQNCIVLFDATDCDDNKKCNSVDISWIGSNDIAKNEANKPKKTIPFRQHLEMIHAKKQSDRCILKARKILNKSKSSHQAVKSTTMSSRKLTSLKQAQQPAQSKNWHAVAYQQYIHPHSRRIKMQHGVLRHSTMY